MNEECITASWAQGAQLFNSVNFNEILTHYVIIVTLYITSKYFFNAMNLHRYSFKYSINIL